MFKWLFGSSGQEASGPARAEPALAAPEAQRAGPSNLVSSASIEEWSDTFGFLGNGSVTRSSAMKLSVSFACVSLLSGTIGTVPVRVVSKDPDGASHEERDHDVNWFMRHEPHEWFTPEVFFESVGAIGFLDGNGYAEIQRDPRGGVRGLRPILDGTVAPFESKSGRMAYRISENGDTYGRDMDDIIHFRGSATMQGYEALSPLKCFGRSIGIGLSADAYAEKFYDQGANPSGFITYDGKVSEQVAEEVRNYWVRKFGGAQGAHLPAVLSEGGKFESLMTDPETAQLFQSRSFQVIDIARAFGIPPHLIGETDKSTSWGTGINAQTMQFYILGLRKHVKRFEGELSRKLLSRAERAAGMSIDFNLNALLRADLSARYEAHKVAVGGTQHPGWMTVNEARALEGLSKIADPQADQLFRPSVKAPEAGAADITQDDNEGDAE